jgi:TatD DNase family protein
MQLFDQHTHDDKSQPGTAWINLSMEVLSAPENFLPVSGQLYSAGIFPLYEGDWEDAFQNLKRLLRHPQVVAVGECGLDKRSPIPFEQQQKFFEAQMILAEELKKPLIIHCVRAWSELLYLCRIHPSEQRRVVHGFRGKPELACQLLDAGLYLSFGARFNADSLRLCPAERRLMETDNSKLTISQVFALQQDAGLKMPET